MSTGIPNISCVLITKNAAETLDRTLASVHKWVDEIVIFDDASTDETKKIAEKYQARYINHPLHHEGKQRILSLQHAKFDWILSLDSDEIVSNKLRAEIMSVLSQKKIPHDAYIFKFRNHFLGKPVSHGGESYSMVRLFRQSKVYIDDVQIHSQYHLRYGEPGVLREPLDHYSYRSLRQVYGKFTSYAKREAAKKFEMGERSGLKQITLYPLHMFYARFIEDGGYKDGWHRIPLDLGFAYMEFLTYWLLLWKRS